MEKDVEKDIFKYTLHFIQIGPINIKINLFYIKKVIHLHKYEVCYKHQLIFMILLIKDMERNVTEIATSLTTKQPS